MILICKILLFFFLFLFVHTYLIYPFIVFLLYTFTKKKSVKLNIDFDQLPFVSCLISAFNEEKIIKQKIISLLESDYPKNKLKIYVGSDASSDQTNLILEELSSEYEQLYYFPFKERRGKPQVLNDLMQEAQVHLPFGSDHIILFTDANVILEKNTLKHLCKHYNNPDVGLVDCQMIPGNIKKDGVSQSEKNYIQLETKLKFWEGELWGCMMGAFGGCYTVRSTYVEEIPKSILVDDFYISMKVLEKKGKCISDLDAIAHEALPGQLHDEFKRKSRISSGNFQNLEIFKSILVSNPFIRAFCFFSHKVIRWLSPIFLLLSFALSLMLSFISPFGIFSTIGGFLLLIFLIIPWMDHYLDKSGIRISPIRHISYFSWMNLALLIGFINYCKGIRSSIWQPTARK